MLSLDVEATGLDLRHTARPFFVTVCDAEGVQRHWEWNICPLTREPQVPEEDKEDIKQVVAAADEIVLQNAKYDAAACAVAGIIPDWPWEKTQDTLLAGHLLASNRPHNLTDMAMQYLGVDIQPWEDRLEVAVQKCRRMVQQARLKTKRAAEKNGQGVLLADPLAGWVIAEKDHPDMPSVKEKSWKQDAFLPRAMRKAGYGKDHPEWDTVLRDYANTDSAVTVRLWQVMRQEIERRGLWRIYEERQKVLRIAYEMEARGVTLNSARLEELTTKYRAESERTERVLTSIASSYRYDLQLPKGGRNKSLDTFIFDVLKLEKVYNQGSKTAGPTLDSKTAVPHYLSTLLHTSKGYHFIKGLAGKRSLGTAISYMESYQRFWLAVSGDTYRLHPSLNHCGTDTLRWSSSAPNEQNISKKENFNLRYCFGPAPGREWWSLDAKNIELRLPAYESGEPDLIELFERPDDPPYYGSVHLLNFHTVFPDVWERELKEVGHEKVGPHCKKKYVASHYQDTKNGGFAKQYGGQRAKVDATFKRKGAFDLLDRRLDRLATLNKKCIAFAEKHGYVETIPDKTVDPKRGYPLLVTRTNRGGVLPTVPLNYRIQGSAMWWMMKAMIRVSEQLREWSLERREGAGYYIALQVHDELVLDLPYKANRGNLPKIRKVVRLMEESGKDFGIPTPVGVEYHEHHWSEGVTV